MEIRKLISKFITQLCEKNYAQANDTLQHVVEEKVKEKIKKEIVKSKKIEKTPSKKEKEAFLFKKGKNPNVKKVSKKGNK